MSPTTSYACNSNVYDVQSEKLLAREVKSSSSSCCPWALRHAPRTLTGSLRDQSARRGAASPLCRASSASYSLVLTQARKSSLSLIAVRILLAQRSFHNHSGLPLGTYTDPTEASKGHSQSNA